MKKRICLMWICCLLMALPAPVLAADTDPADLPWETAYLNLGYYWATLNSSLRFGETALGLGVDLDVENLLSLDSSKGSFRVEGAWRFSKNKRHKIELGWFRFHRDGSTVVIEPIPIPPEIGDDIPPGQFNSTFNFDILKAKYEYSFLLDDRVDLNVGAGLFVMPFEIGLFVEAGGAGSREIKESVTAPLPVLSAGFDIVLTPQWYLRQQSDFFYLDIDNYEGGILDIQFAVEYLPWKNVGFGLGVDYLSIFVEADGNTSVPGVDFNGKINFETTGLQLYLKLFM